MWTIIVILAVLWLLGAFGGRVIPSFPKTGGWIHTLIVDRSHPPGTTASWDYLTGYQLLEILIIKINGVNNYD